MGNLHSVGRPPKVGALTWMAGCSLVFLVVYGGCNWLTAQRNDVGTWYFPWELQIPFVPWMIVPYWSIDFFFLGSFFVCRTRSELRVHGRRILLAIGIAGAFFLVMPLRIAFPRPDVSGVFGAMFTALRAFDQPYNLFPSLHIALWQLLRAAYVRHTTGLLRWAIKLWFVLIGISTLLTWQHHVVDLLGGFGLAAVCFYVFRESSSRLPVTPNRRVGGYYAVGAVVSTALAVWGRPWAGILLWPALSLGIMAGAYFGMGPGVFRKEQGSLPLSAKLMLGPVLLGQRLSLVYYRRQCAAWNAIAPGVWIGRVLRPAEVEKLPTAAVLDLTAEFAEPAPLRQSRYRNLPILDLTAPTHDQLREAVAFITEHAGNGGVYVHCKIGYSRTAAVVGAYLLASRQAHDADDALRQLRQTRTGIVIRPEAETAVRNFTLHEEKHSQETQATVVRDAAKPGRPS